MQWFEEESSARVRWLFELQLSELCPAPRVRPRRYRTRVEPRHVCHVRVPVRVPGCCHLKDSFWRHAQFFGELDYQALHKAIPLERTF